MSSRESGTQIGEQASTPEKPLMISASRKLIVIYGSPGTGKTYLAKALSRTFALPLLYQMLEAQMAAGRSCIVECNFRKDWDAGKLGELFANRRLIPWRSVSAPLNGTLRISRASSIIFYIGKSECF